MAAHSLGITDLDNVDGFKNLKINHTWTKNSLRSNNKQNVLAYHLEDLRVPLVVRVPQVGNHWFRETETASQSAVEPRCMHNNHQNTPKPRFIAFSVFRWNSCGLSKCLKGPQGKTFKKTLLPTDFYLCEWWTWVMKLVESLCLLQSCMWLHQKIEMLHQFIFSDHRPIAAAIKTAKALAFQTPKTKGLLSPYLLTVCLDELSMQLRTTREGRTVGNMVVNHLLFADDLKLVPASIVSNVFWIFVVITLLNVNHFKL